MNGTASALLLQPEAYLGGFALVAARVVPSVVMLPAFGAPSLPLLLRLGFGVAIAGWLSIDQLPTVFAASPLLWFVWFIRELAVGCALAWLCSLVFRAVNMAGQMVDVARLAETEQVADPMDPDGAPSTPLSALYGLLGAVLFAELGGPGHIIAALARTYEVLPLVSPAALSLPDSLVGFVARVVGGVVEAAVGLAAPVIVAVWLTELSVSLVCRAVGSGSAGLTSVVRMASPLAGLGVVLITLGLVRAGIEGWVAKVPALLLHSITLWVRS